MRNITMIILALILVPLYGQDIKFSNLEESIENNRKQRIKILRNLQQAKWFMIQGKIKRSKDILKNMNLSNDLNLIKLRYLAIIYFLEGDYKNSSKILDNNLFKIDPYYSSVCTLKSILLLKKSEKEFNQNIDQCLYKTEVDLDSFKWLLKIADIKFNKTRTNPTINQFYAQTSTLENSIRYLKLGLINKQEREIVDYLKYLPNEQFSSPKIRELLASYLYRTGNLGQAQQFLKDVNFANAYNIKGLINIENNEFELAYANFKYSLIKKQHSSTALEYALPLSWLLNRPLDSFKYTKAYESNLYQNDGGVIFKAANLSRMKKYHLSQNEINNILPKYSNYLPEIIGEIYLHNSIGTENNLKIKKIAEENCKKFDYISCFILNASHVWGNINKVSIRDEMPSKIIQTNYQDIIKNNNIGAVDDEVYIDQFEIEELDMLNKRDEPLFEL